MKENGMLSAIVGGSFFAASYLALSVALVPSLVIGGAAFCAGELVFKNGKKTLKEKDYSLYKILENAKKQNNHIVEMLPRIDNEEIRINLNEINDTVNKIIQKIQKSPNLNKKLNNFFEYYLPVTIKIVDRYDEIENQKLTSKEIKDFNDSTLKMIKEANNAYKKLLNKLYSKEMVDSDVEMKVFNTMLKADGLDKTDFKSEE